MENRREFIKKAAFLAGSTGLWSTLPPSLKRALEINPEPGTTFYDAQHIVLLMQENRSFDHCFGTLKGVRGFNDPRAITLPNKNLVWLQSDKESNTYAPFRLNIKDTKSTWMGSLPHSWENQVDARNGGKYDGWLAAKPSGYKEYKDMPLTLGYFNREDIPFYYAFADAFTVCDQHFCSSLTGTTTNRLFFWSGALKGEPGAKANVRNSDVYYNREVDWKTFPERLEEHGVSWKVYQNELSVQTELEGEEEYWLANFTDNNLEWFKQYHVRFSSGHRQFLSKRVRQLPQEIADLEKEMKQLKPNQIQPLKKKMEQKKAQLAKYKVELAKYNPANFAKLSTFEQHLHQRAFTTNSNDPHYHQIEEFKYDDQGEERSMHLPKGDVLHQFRTDVNQGNLPTVSWLVAPQAFSDHPSSPWFGAWYISEVLDILTKNPEVWKKTIFMLTYDENDGYFDHVPPFVAPKPNDRESGAVSAGLDTTDEYVTLEEEWARPDLKKEDARESPVGLGYRVPLIIASPWTRGGWVNSEVCDITSTIRFMEKFLEKKTGKKVLETNISSWRRSITGDLSSAFRPYNGEEIALPETVELSPFVQSIHNARFKGLPNAYKRLTKEEVESIHQNPVNTPLLPQQETGIKDSNALPYELYVDGEIENGALKINFEAANRLFGNKAAGAAFNVYAPANYLQKRADDTTSFEPVKTWAFAVKAGDRLTYRWPLDHFEQGYYLRVYGPNGFFREFQGNNQKTAVAVSCGYEGLDGQTNKPTGNVLLRISNLDQDKKGQINVQLKDWAYGNKPITKKISAGETILLKVDTGNSYGWYDFSLFVEGMSDFERRYAGRVETGRDAKSDPFMGRVMN
ncbi:phosphocholine-specific phospholipase C [Olivibacter sp. XZL3]|uniref:phosphocholine-specific phospholipase C n=1 Tax=Olivibacter sp. XZL3 TaxID=1735116 RepID=UPI001064FB25|nr:phospholipase C, phosphocholine-specific [Olivibacter sp. XZL3]